MYKQKSHRRLIIISIILALLLSGGAYAFWRNQSNDFSEETNKTGGAQKPESKDVKLKEDGTPIETTKPGAGSDAASSSSEAAVQMTSYSYNSSSGIISVRAFVTGVTSGSCVAVFTQDDKKLEKRADLQAQASFYACKGFDVTRAEFPAGGEWNIKVRYEGNGNTAESNSGKINL
jgi:hypothetical protein